MSNKEVISALNNLDLSSYPYKEVMELVNQFMPKIIRLTLPPVYAIERMRPDGDIFVREGISYKPAHLNKYPQRATLPNQTAFYGTLCGVKEPLFNNRKLALSEASKLFRRGEEAEGVETYTISRWRTKGTLMVAVFVHEDVFTNADDNEILKSAKAFKMANKTFLDGSMQFDLYEKYVTEQFAKPVINDYDYIITATIADRLMYASELDGVLYPSVQCDGRFGMNVALKPAAVDAKLFLEQVHELSYSQFHGVGELRFSKHFVPGDQDAQGFKNWTYIDWSDEAPDYYKS